MCRLNKVIRTHNSLIYIYKSGKQTGAEWRLAQTLLAGRLLDVACLNPPPSQLSTLFYCTELKLHSILRIQFSWCEKKGSAPAAIVPGSLCQCTYRCPWNRMKISELLCQPLLDLCFDIFSTVPCVCIIPICSDVAVDMVGVLYPPPPKKKICMQSVCMHCTSWCNFYYTLTPW